MNRIESHARFTAGSLVAVGKWVLLFDSVSECAGDRHVALTFASRTGQPSPIQGSCSFEQSARCWSRRVWVHSGPDASSRFLPLPIWRFPTSCGLTALSPFATVRLAWPSVGNFVGARHLSRALPPHFPNSFPALSERAVCVVRLVGMTAAQAAALARTENSSPRHPWHEWKPITFN